MRLIISVLTLLALAGCSLQPSPRDIPASLTKDQAIERYEPVFDEMSAAVKDEYPGNTYTLENELDVVEASDCSIWIGQLKNGTTKEADRDDYLALIEPIAEDAGFSTLTELETSEGAPYRPSLVGQDDRGAELRVTFENPGLTISIVSSITDDPCPN